MIDDSYLAGLLDGEGHVSIIYRARRGDRKNEMQCYVYVGFTMTDRGPIDALAERFGGSVYQYQQPDPRWNDWYRWQCSGQRAEKVLRAARPYVLVKGPHIDICLKHQELIVQGGRAKAERAAYNAECFSERLALRAELKILNRRGKEEDGSRSASRSPRARVTAAET